MTCGFVLSKIVANFSILKDRATMNKRISGFLVILFAGALVWLTMCSGPKSAPKDAPTLRVSGLTYQAIQNKRDASTDVQWDTYADSIRGVRVHWSGYVLDAKASGEIWIDMDSPDSLLSVQEVYIEVPREDVSKYSKGQKITFTGTIRSAVSVLGNVNVTLQDVTIP